MSVTRPAGLRAGFHAEPDPGAGLIHAGEQWAPGTFAIDRHAHAGWELYLQADGTTGWRVAGELRRLAAGDLLAVAPGVEHELEFRPAANHHFLYAAFEPAAIPVALRPAWSGRFRHVAGADRLLPAFQTLVRELALRLPYATEGLRAALDVLLVEATRVLAAPRVAPVLAAHPAVTATRELLDARCDRRWPLAELAARSGLSARHLHGLFTREVGVTPHRYQQERRMRRAHELLTTTDLPVTAIAFELGFASSQQFARDFRRRFGHSPTDARRLAVQHPVLH